MTLLCAATKWEAFPLAESLGLAQVADGVFQKADGSIILLKTGMGREKTAKALGQWRAAASVCRAVISTGFCGALQRGMRTGDIVADLGGCDITLVEKARRAAETRGLSIHFGKIVHSDAVVSSPAQKEDLGKARRASAVDMESAAIRDWAAKAGAAALCLRVVLDPLEQRLPRRLPQGEDFFSLLRYALSNPSQLPLLAHIAYRQRRASASLARFLGTYLETP